MCHWESNSRRWRSTAASNSTMRASCASARVAVGGLGDGPLRSGTAESGLAGVSAGDSDAIAAALQAASDEIETQSDMWADSDYRKLLIRSLGAEVIASAFARAAT